MKIAYVVDEDLSKTTGVSKKIASKIAIWEKMGHTVAIFSMRSGPGIHVAPSGVFRIRFGRLGKLLRHWREVGKLNAYLKNFKPDIIYCRYIKFAPFLSQTLSTHGKYVVEVNTDDSVEFFRRGILNGVYNIITRSAFLTGACGFVFVTNELSQKKVFTKFNKPACIIGNGYILTELALESRKSKRRRSGQINLVFAGTAGMSWHGIDKVIAMARGCPDFQFHLAGFTSEAIKAKVPSNFKFHGWLNSAQLFRLYQDMDVAISTLALHRNMMQEACPLKSREYLSFGLPIISGYQDTDLSAPVNFVLQLENCEDNVASAISVIRSFCLGARDISKASIMEFSATNLDSVPKECSRIIFLESIVNGATVSGDD